MEHVTTISDIVGGFGEGSDEVQVCARADADYDHTEGRVTVRLGNDVRHALRAGVDGVPAWLPAAETVHEHVPRDEVIDFTKDVFQGWVKRVRAAIPPDATLRAPDSAASDGGPTGSADPR